MTAVKSTSPQDATGAANARGLSRAMRVALSLAVLCASLALYRQYHAKNWDIARRAALHVARTMRPGAL